MDLKGKTALVTGAGRGIGREIALALAGEGCKVVAVSRTEKEIAGVERAIIENGGEALKVAADISRKTDRARVIEAARGQFGSLDILVNNAGVHFVSPFLEVTEEEFDANMNVNLKATFFLSQAAIKLMIEQRRGYIVNVSSTAAITVPSRAAAYGISKLGVAGLTQALYELGKEYGVKVSVIYPGMTDTKMLRDAKLPVDPSFWMLPEDIAGCVIFLLKQSERVAVREMVPWAARHDRV